jgi:hypothetical protein
VARAEMDVRPGGIFGIDIATEDGQEFPILGCSPRLDVHAVSRLSPGRLRRRSDPPPSSR